MFDIAHKEAPVCTVIICTKGRPAELERCLASISRLDYPRFAVLVLENVPRNSLNREIAARWGANVNLNTMGTAHILVTGSFLEHH